MEGSTDPLGMQSRVLHQFELRRRRSPIAAQGSSVRENPGEINSNHDQTLKGLGRWRTLSGFNDYFCDPIPRLSLRSNLGLKLANAFGVFQTLRRISN